MQVDGLSISADGRLYLARRADAFVIGEVDTLAEVCRFPRDGAARQVWFHPDSRRVVVDSVLGTIEVLELRTGRVLRKFESTQRLLAMDPEGNRIFCNAPDGLMVRELETGGAVLTSAPWLREMREVGRVDVFADDWILVAGEPGSFVTHLIALRLKSGDSRLLKKNCPVREVWPLPDRRRAVVVEDDGSSKLWDVAAGEQVRVLAEPGWAIQSQLDDAGRRLLAVSVAGAMREVSVADGIASLPQNVALPTALDANRREVLSIVGDEVIATRIDGGLHRWRVDGALRAFGAGARWYAATTHRLLLLESDRPRIVWEGGSAPTAVVGARSGLLIGTEDGAVHH